MKTLLVIVSLILFSACASTPQAPRYWTRDGHTYSKEENYGKDEFERHEAGCNAQLAFAPFARTPEGRTPGQGVGSVSLGDGLMSFGAAMNDIARDMAMRENFLMNCLRAQGWRIQAGVRPTDAAPTPTPATK